MSIDCLGDVDCSSYWGIEGNGAEGGMTITLFRV